MGWWFGRKSAPADARPYVPAWLHSDAAGEGFARSYEAQYEEVFRRNPVGQRAVRLVSGMLGSLTIDAVEGDAKVVALVQANGLLESLAANLLLHGNAYAVPQEIDRGDRRDADRDLADSRDRQCREGRNRRLSQADHHRRDSVRLGRLRGARGRRLERRASTRSCRRRASSMPIRRRPSRCSTTRRSTSRNGWRTRSRPSSRAPRARLLSAAPASTSRSGS